MLKRPENSGRFIYAGFFHTRVTGLGKVYIQSMPICHTAQALAPYLNFGDKDINIKLGD